MDLDELEALATAETNIRYALGATGDRESLISEAEILHFHGLYPDEWRLAAAGLARSLAAKAIDNPSGFGLTGLMSVSWDDQAAAWRAIAARLIAEVEEQRKLDVRATGIQSVMLTREKLRAEKAEFSPRRSKGLSR